MTQKRGGALNRVKKQSAIEYRIAWKLFPETIKGRKIARNAEGRCRHGLPATGKRLGGRNSSRRDKQAFAPQKR